MIVLIFFHIYFFGMYASILNTLIYYSRPNMPIFFRKCKRWVNPCETLAQQSFRLFADELSSLIFNQLQYLIKQDVFYKVKLIIMWKDGSNPFVWYFIYSCEFWMCITGIAMLTSEITYMIINPLLKNNFECRFFKTVLWICCVPNIIAYVQLHF